MKAQSLCIDASQGPLSKLQNEYQRYMFWGRYSHGSSALGATDGRAIAGWRLMVLLGEPTFVQIDLVPYVLVVAFVRQGAISKL